MKQFDMVSVGSALRDVMFYSDQFLVIRNPKHNDPTVQRLMCSEYGAKIRSNRVFFMFGGGAANVAINCAGLGLKTGIITAIGHDDIDAQAILQQMDKSGIDSSFIQRTKRFGTGFSFLAIDERTGEHVAYIYYGASQDIFLPASTIQQFETKWFYIASLNTKQWKEALQVLFTKHNSAIAWNPGNVQLQSGYRGLRQFLKKTDILILNKDEATELVFSHQHHQQRMSIPQMMTAIYGFGPQIVVITDARNGSYAFDGKKQYSTKSVSKKKPLDTTGAGDCYGSSFVAGIIRYNGNIEKSMKLASKNAASLVQHIGAQNGLLQWKDLPKNLQRSV